MEVFFIINLFPIYLSAYKEGMKSGVEWRCDSQVMNFFSAPISHDSLQPF